MAQYNEAILLKYGELVLKGLNKSYFEGQLLRDIASRLQKYGEFSVKKAQSTVYVTPVDENAVRHMDDAHREMGKVFGIAAYSRAAVVEKNIDTILSVLPDYVAPKLNGARTFKVEAKRSDKTFPLDSPAISRLCGGALLDRFHHLKVDVKKPDVTVIVEIRDFAAYLHCDAEEGAGGMPVGSSGKALLLLSGGIDSPVAGYRVARRGVTVDALHFESYPYTSVQAREKVIELAEIMADTCGDIHLNIISVTHIQEELRDKCREEYFTLLLRRFMMRIAERIALRYGCGAIVTGESIGQVASQTLPALAVTNDAVKSIPILRPLIAHDKEEIVRIARKIGTFDTSILPYEDCCTVFTPKHPVTKPELSKLVEEEKKLDVEALIEEALATRTYQKIERA